MAQRIKLTIDIMVRMFANSPGDLGSVPDQVIPKTQKWYLMSPCLTLCIIRYWLRVKWSNPRKRVVPSPTPWCCSYRKGRLGVTLDYCCQLTKSSLLNITPCEDPWCSLCNWHLNLSEIMEKNWLSIYIYIYIYIYIVQLNGDSNSVKPS